MKVNKTLHKSMKIYENQYTSMQNQQKSEEHIGTYYSREWVRKNILMQTEDEIKDIDAQIAKEIDSGDIDDPDDDMDDED